MELETFLITMRELCKKAREERVSITWSIFENYAEISIEPYQETISVVNNGSQVNYK